MAGQVAHQTNMDAGLVQCGNEAVASLQQAPDSESEEGLEWKVLSIVEVKGKGPQRHFQVLWAATADAGEAKTWEPEAQLVQDGWPWGWPEPHPIPHVNTAPSLVHTAVWSNVADTPTTNFSASANTDSGNSLPLIRSWPSLPSSPLPQVHTPPDSVSITVNPSPASTPTPLCRCP